LSFLNQSKSDSVWDFRPSILLIESFGLFIVTAFSFDFTECLVSRTGLTIRYSVLLSETLLILSLLIGTSIAFLSSILKSKFQSSFWLTAFFWSLDSDLYEVYYLQQ
jgi:hypothetical protein